MNRLFRSWSMCLSRLLLVVFSLLAFSGGIASKPLPESGLYPINPRFITDPVRFDTDDVKIWVHPDDPARSLLIGTDKHVNGGLFVWNLRGQLQEDLVVRDLRRPNNLDILQGIETPTGTVDIVVTTERKRHQLRVFSLPDMKPIDGGGIPVFENASESEPMGIGLWQRPEDGAVFAVVSGKTGPTYDYLRQYRLEWDEAGMVSGAEVRRFGRFSGLKEIEAIVIDRRLHAIFYSDEGYGIRKYHADPDHPQADLELAFIPADRFEGDIEGLSLYDIRYNAEGQPVIAGYLMASDQQANRMHFFRREGAPGNPHQHDWVHSVVISAHSSDGNAIHSGDFGPLFPTGIMAAMSEGRTFHLYNWDTLAEEVLTVAPNGRAIVDWIWSGGVTPRSAVITAQLGHREEIVLLVSDNEKFSHPIRLEAQRMSEVPGGWIARFEVTGLEPGTRYHYLIERKGRVVRKHAGEFTTFPDERKPLRVAMGSCANTGSNHPVFDTIAGLRPDFFLHLGDLHYEDIAVNDPSHFYHAFARVLGAPRQSALYRSTSIAYMWDDHDYGPNNSDRTSPSREAALTAYRTAVPHYPLECPEEDAVYQAFSFGKVRFILSDLRSQRPSREVADGPERSMMGPRQKAWFLKELEQSSRTHDLVVWVNGVPWIGDDGHYDRWSGFTYERREIANFIEARGIKNLCVVSGDAHMVAIDDGTHNTYSDSQTPGFPLLQAAALDRRGSVKGGPYSHGTFPGPGQFGFLEVNYPGDGTVEVILSGRNSSGETLLEHRFSLPTIQPETP